MIPKRYEKVKYEDVPNQIRGLFENMPKTKKGLYIHGAVGTGKTHIVYALSESSWAKGRTKVYNSTDILRRIRADFSRKGSEKEYFEEMLIEMSGLLIIDDVGSEKISDWVLETFYHIINKRYNDMKLTIFTSNFQIADLAQRIGDRTSSRIVEMCNVVELVGKDRRLDNKQRIKINI
jgi:DNA replication protein DnaC